MDGETIPLLQAASKQDGNGENANETSLPLESSTSEFRIAVYGTNSQLRPSKIIPLNQRITYTWSEINVFSEVLSTKSNGCLNLCKKSPDDPSRKHILKNVTGIAYPGELLAILGSSGAGKTTLLNTLTFQNYSNMTVSGLRCINGVPVSLKALASQSAYVQQNDLFIGNLTVKEHLIFQALVRMDKDISYQQRMERVDEVISELSLAKCQNTQIGIPGRIQGISGGEMKRLSFAAEVLTNPRLMFCDEPTSGLDSFMAYTVIQVLKTMATTGKTIICTIHQPSSEIYAMFDKILLMSEGRIAFLGTPEEAILFFQEMEAPCPHNYNPADYFIQLLAILPERDESCRQAVTSICDTYERSTIGIKVSAEAANIVKDSAYPDLWLNGSAYRRTPYKASWCSQFRALLWRSWITVIKEPLLIKVRVLQTIIISLVISSMYFGQVLDQDGVMNINGVIFLFLINMTFQNVFAVVNVFCSELPIFLRENRNGMYRTDVYFLCKTIAESPIFLVLPVIYTAISYYLIGLNPALPRFFLACGIMILVCNVAISFGYLVSCLSTSVSMALSLGPPLIIPFLLFGGFFLNISSVPIYFEWLSYLSWFRYGNEALMINQWNGVVDIKCTIVNSTCPRDGHIVLTEYSFVEDNFVRDIICLACLIAGFRMIAFVALLIKTYKYKS